MKVNRSKVSIQVSLNGYSFQTVRKDSYCSFGWKHWDCTEDLPVCENFEQVEVSVFTPLFTLVPSQFFNPDRAGILLGEVVELPEDSIVEFESVPDYEACMIYSFPFEKKYLEDKLGLFAKKDFSDKVLPHSYFQISYLRSLPEHNKIIASYVDGYLYLTVGGGKDLLFCNSFKADTFTTAEYYIFLVVKALNMNPEASSITFLSQITREQEMSLYRYFKSVIKL